MCVERKQGWWIEYGLVGVGMCIRDSCSRSSRGVGPVWFHSNDLFNRNSMSLGPVWVQFGSGLGP